MKTDYEVHPASNATGIESSLSLGIKRAGHEADHSPPSTAEIKNAWSYTFTCRGAWLSTGKTLPLPLNPSLTSIQKCENCITTKF